jgi:hypothetical protein
MRNQARDYERSLEKIDNYYPNIKIDLFGNHMYGQREVKNLEKKISCSKIPKWIFYQAIIKKISPLALMLFIFFFNIPLKDRKKFKTSYYALAVIFKVTQNKINSALKELERMSILNVLPYLTVVEKEKNND